MSEWVSKPIGDLLKAQFAGEWGSDPSLPGELVRVFRGADFVASGFLKRTGGALRRVSSSKLKKVELKPGDILLEKSGGSPDQPVGRVSHFEGSESRAVASNFLQTLRPSENVNSKFLFYLLQHEYARGRVLPFQQQTTGLINFRLKDYLKERVALPVNPGEQRRIADLLSAVDEQIDLLEAYAYKKNALLSGLIDALLLAGTRLKTLSDFCEVGPKTSALDAPASVPFVSMDSVSEAGVLVHREHRSWVGVSKGFTRFTGGDVLVAKITPCFENGKGFQAPQDAKLWAGSTEFHVLRAKEGVCARWVFWHSRSREFLAKGAMQMTGSAGQQRVPRRFIEEFPVFDDKLAVQEKKAALLDAVSAELQGVEAQIEKLKKQKRGLLGDLLQQSPSHLQTAVVKHDK